MKDGRITETPATIADSARYAATQLRKLPAEHQRIENPHRYKVGISDALELLRDKMIVNIKKPESS